MAYGIAVKLWTASQRLDQRRRTAGETSAITLYCILRINSLTFRRVSDRTHVTGDTRHATPSRHTRMDTRHPRAPCAHRPPTSDGRAQDRTDVADYRTHAARSAAAESRTVRTVAHPTATPVARSLSGLLTLRASGVWASLHAHAHMPHLGHHRCRARFAF